MRGYEENGPVEGAWSRRVFLGVGLAGLGAAALPAAPARAALVAGPPPADAAELAARGAPTAYTGAALPRIGMPVGGACSGQVYLAGDGTLWNWDIFNPTSYPYGGTGCDGPHYAHPLRADTAPAPFRQGFTIRVQGGRARTLDAAGFPGARFVGRYPIGTTTYRADGVPVEVTGEAFSPFVPLATDDSTLPATIMAYTVRNTTGRPLRVELAGATENPVCVRTRTQQPVRLHGRRLRAPGAGGVEFSADAGAYPAGRDILFEDWEGDGFGGWTVTGEAFGDGPVAPADVPAGMRRFGDLNVSGRRFVTSYAYRSKRYDDAAGTLTSKEFTIERRYVMVVIGGGRRPGEACVNVVVDGDVVATATGADGEPMLAATLDVGDHRGKRAHLEIVDRATGDWGHVNVSEIVFTDVADIVFEDWENGAYDGWTVTGDAFGEKPVRAADVPPYFRNPVGEITDLNVSGTYFVTSHNFRAGGDADGYQGRMTSRPFTIERRYVTAWVGGGGFAGGSCLNVVVDGRVVASLKGRDAEPLSATSVDVSPWTGRTARIELVDTETGPWGHINVDRIVFGDRPVRRRPVAAWPDRGTFCLAALEDGADVRQTDDDGTVTVGFTLAPHASRTVRFAFAWYFPTFDPAMFSWLTDGESLRYHYAKRFGSAGDVVAFLARERARLERRTRDWVRTWYEDSTLPHWFLERTLSTASTLATNTCYRFDNGRFYAWEGIYDCVGTCEHVWSYAQAVARLFPELERDTRERVDLGIALLPTGEMKNRGESTDGGFTDGQCGTILRIYREHQMSPDTAFLRRNWPDVRRALAWMVGQDAGGGTANGILDAGQWNTLDARWFGEIPWLSGLYVAALRAGAAMAGEVGDTDSARRYDDLADQGAAHISGELWNAGYGYFVQKTDPDHPTAVNSNRGSFIDQMYGQTYAAQLGLPRVFPANKARTALARVYANNFLADAGGYRAPGVGEPRVYATKGEAGTVMCAWPHGGSTESGSDGPVFYFNEAWTGQEYQFAAHLFAEGMAAPALAVTHAVHERYHGEKRNPYNEVECSDHYARAMMSFGAYLAACGYEHHGPRGHLGFAPRLTPDDFRAAFTAAEGWGLYRQRRSGRTQTGTVEVRYGRLRLTTLAFEVTGTTVTSATVAGVGAVRHATSPGVTGTRVELTLPKDITLHEGDHLEVHLTTT